MKTLYIIGLIALFAGLVSVVALGVVSILLAMIVTVVLFTLFVFARKRPWLFMILEVAIFGLMFGIAIAAIPGGAFFR